MRTEVALQEVFLGKGFMEIRSKFTGENPCRSAISIKLLGNFIEIAHRHGFSPVNLLHIFKTYFPKNTSEGLLLQEDKVVKLAQCVECLKKTKKLEGFEI